MPGIRTVSRAIVGTGEDAGIAGDDGRGAPVSLRVESRPFASIIL
jgi:hypothetical protein